MTMSVRGQTFRGHIEHRRALGPGRDMSMEFFDGIKGDDLDVLGLIIERIQAGAATYGVLEILDDLRDPAEEALHELVDATYYLAWRTIRERRPSPLEEVRERIIARFTAMQEIAAASEPADVAGYAFLKAIVNAEFEKGERNGEG